ncbi:MAG: hypothetical protein L3J74_11350 [Bacteroidales bacterium]|nr:hypothetical protein [Bacteroidales bacterium]
MTKKILFVLSGNLSTTPRALKTILSLKNFYAVKIYAINRNDTWLKLDKNLCEEYNLSYFYSDLKGSKKSSWFINSIRYKIAKFKAKIIINNIRVNAFAISKASILLCNMLGNKKKEKYDAIYGFSFSSLYPAYKFAEQTNTPFNFDVEDYHPGEAIGTDAENEKNRRIFLMKKLLPKAKFITYASPLIGEYTHKLISGYPKNNMLLVNNVFSKTEFEFKENNTEKIKLVWFSQNIAAGRGLELVIPALANFKDKIELHLIGNLYQNFHNDFLKNYVDFVKVTPPLPQKQLNLKLSEYDIGLAIEPGKDLNNNIAVSNKIWAYFQAGLYVFATNTPAQKQFISEHKTSGIIAEQNIEDIKNKIQQTINNIETIRKEKKQRFNEAQNFAWENESKKLLKIWNEI